MRVCSIDVGKVNLGVYVEEFDNYLTGKGLYLQRVDLTQKKNDRVCPEFLHRLFTYLDTIKQLLSTCDYIVIEKQLRANPEAQFVDHALQSYAVLHFSHNKVISFSSKNKTKLFDGTKMTKYQRKKWATQKAQEVLYERNETELLDYVKSLKKKDDVSDAICQLDAWKLIHYKKLGQISDDAVQKAEKKREELFLQTQQPKRGKKSVASQLLGDQPLEVQPKRSKKKEVAIDASATVQPEEPKRTKKKTVPNPLPVDDSQPIEEQNKKPKRSKKKVSE
jgi:hypothetical protein